MWVILPVYQIRINIDTTVKTVYGHQQGARKGHNTQHRGKEGLRPILGFIEETREYLLGKLRKGTTVDGEEVGKFIDSLKPHLPGCVQDVLLRADGELLKQPSNQPQQCVLFEDDKYTHRIFYTNLAGKAHKIIAEYDKRADVENLVGEAKREGLDMIPSAKFKNNYAFSQIVMLAYNIWRYMKMIAQKSISGHRTAKGSILKGIITNTVRIARLKLLFIAAKVVNHSNRDTIKYSIHDSRTPEMFDLLQFLDNARSSPRAWNEELIWSPRFAIQ